VHGFGASVQSFLIAGVCPWSAAGRASGGVQLQPIDGECDWAHGGEVVVNWAAMPWVMSEGTSERLESLDITMIWVR